MQIYTFRQLYQKYNLLKDDKRMGGTTETKIRYLERCGIIVEELPTEGRTKKFKIVDDTIFTNPNWKKHPTKPFELTPDGMVRNSELKTLYKLQLEQHGYINVADHEAHHRLLMETFNPRPNSEWLTVDHLNGVRNDNRLENLEWVSPATNTKRMSENQQAIFSKVQQLIQTKGY